MCRGVCCFGVVLIFDIFHIKFFDLYFVLNLGKTVRVDVCIRNTKTSMRCTLFYDDARSLHDQIVEKVRKEVSLGSREAQWSAFTLYSGDGCVPCDLTSVKDDEVLILMIPTKIVAESASSWSSVKVEQLRIRFVDVTVADLNLNTTFTLSEKANALVEHLKPLNVGAVDEYAHLNSVSQIGEEMMALLDYPLIKAVFMVSKYVEIESPVDLFMVLLLHELGYYNGRLFAFPQFPMDLRFGDTNKQAIPDITVMDVLSFMRMVVVEDKKSSATLLNSEPQLIAELIAMHQRNICREHNVSKKRGWADHEDVMAEEKQQEEQQEEQQESKSNQGQESLEDLLKSEDGLVGIRVTGTSFRIYVMRVSEHVLNAMNYQTQAVNDTFVQRIGPLDFKNEEDRGVLISFLDYFRGIMMDKGASSPRRRSR